MEAEFFRTLFDYSFWARDRLLSAMAGMTDEEYAKENGFTYGSIRGIVTHVMGSEAAYLNRWSGEQGERVTAEVVPTLESMTARWLQEESRMRAFLSKLTDAETVREIVSVRRSGEEFRRPLWQDMMQIFNHGTQHRSEAAEALTMVGRSPGDLDFAAFVQQRAGLSAR